MQVGDATLTARRSTLEARKKEATEDKDGIGTEGTAVPGEMYSAEREWVSEEVQQADKEQKGGDQDNKNQIENRGSWVTYRSGVNRGVE